MTSINQIKSLNVSDVSNISWTEIGNNLPSGISTSNILDGKLKVGFIKNLQDMGITSPNNVDTTNSTKNMNGYQKYTDALLTGNSSAITDISNNGAHLGNREFTKNTGIQCMDNTQQVQDRWFVVDGMAYLNGDSTKNGLMFSAYQTLQDAKDLSNNASDIVTNNMSDNNCISVNLIKNSNGDTEKGYISTNEYNILKKKSPSIFASTNEGFLGDGGHGHGHGGGHGHGHGHGHDGGHYNSGSGGYGLFYNYGVYPGYRTFGGFFRSDSGEKSPNNEGRRPELFELEENREKKLTIEDDIITGFFLGSLTVLSLFLLYRLFERMPSKMED